MDAVPRPFRSRRLLALVVVAGVLLGGCVQTAPPAPAVQRTTAPPWDAPRDAISDIEAAGLAQLPLDENRDPHTFMLTITRNAQPVTIAANIGIDRVRAVQAEVHTHDTTGQVWLEGPDNDQVTLHQFFTVWGVRFTDSCLGDVCGRVTVTVDGTPASGPVTAVRLVSAKQTLAVAVSGAPG